jgi:hypothetical protein
VGGNRNRIAKFLCTWEQEPHKKIIRLRNTGSWTTQQKCLHIRARAAMYLNG